MKICLKCGELKSLEEFYLDKTSKDGKRSACKECIKEYDRQWRIKNPEYYRQWFIKHPEYDRQKYIRNKKKIKIRKHQRYIENREENLARHYRWCTANPEKYKASYKKSGAKKRSTLKGRLNSRMSSAICHSLKGFKAGRHWEDLVGYTINQLKKHLEKLFKPGMVWENYGTFWEIDHKTPIIVFNFDKPEHIDFRLCWSLKNLQPLGVRENRHKHGRISNFFQPSLKIEII